MKHYLIIISGAVLTALFCFSDLYPLPLTRTCYTPPEEKIDMSLTEKFIYIEKMNREDNFSFNFGIWNDTSVGFDFSLLHYGVSPLEHSVPGDILFNIWHFTGDFSDGRGGTGINVTIRIPSGPDAYTDEKCRNLSFGNNELKVTPVLSYKITGEEILVFNISYIFREGRGESLYSGFNFNLKKSKTYKSVFGLNPFYEGSFFDSDNLRNDYASISLAAITSRLYPFVFFIEIYYSSSVCRGDKSLSGINIEGDGVNPLLVSAGMKYFFSGNLFFQVSDIVNPLQNDNYLKNTLSFSMNIFF